MIKVLSPGVDPADIIIWYQGTCSRCKCEIVCEEADVAFPRHTQPFVLCPTKGCCALNDYDGTLTTRQSEILVDRKEQVRPKPIIGFKWPWWLGGKA